MVSVIKSYTDITSPSRGFLRPKDRFYRFLPAFPPNGDLQECDSSMVKPQRVGKNIRMSFSKIEEPLEMPSLIEVQKESFNWFLEKGLMEVLEDVSPITDYTGNLFIDFVGYSLDSKPKYPVEECRWHS